MRLAKLALVLAFAASLSCALVVGLEDKQPLSGAAADGATDGATDGPEAALPLPAPEIVVSNQDRPFDVAVDSSNIYWSNEGPEGMSSGTVVRRGKSDDNPVVVLAADQPYPHYLALDATHVYWNSGNNPPRTDPDGGGPMYTATLARTTKDKTDAAALIDSLLKESTASLLQRIAIYDGVRIADGGVGTDTFLFGTRSIYVWRYTRLGGGAAVETAQQNPLPLAVDEAYVYWGNLGDYKIQRRAKVPDAGDDSATLANELDGIRDMTVDDTWLYWVNARGAVLRLRKDGTGGKPIVLAGGGDNAFHMALDPTHVFWTRSSPDAPTDGEVLMVDKDAQNATPTVVADGQNDPRGIAADYDVTSKKVMVYWANPGSGNIMRCAIP